MRMNVAEVGVRDRFDCLSFVQYWNLEGLVVNLMITSWHSVQVDFEDEESDFYCWSFGS